MVHFRIPNHAGHIGSCTFLEVISILMMLSEMQLLNLASDGTYIAVILTREQF